MAFIHRLRHVGCASKIGYHTRARAKMILQRIACLRRCASREALSLFASLRLVHSTPLKHSAMLLNCICLRPRVLRRPL